MASVVPRVQVTNKLSKYLKVFQSAWLLHIQNLFHHSKLFSDIMLFIHLVKKYLDAMSEIDQTLRDIVLPF